MKLHQGPWKCLKGGQGSNRGLQHQHHCISRESPHEHDIGTRIHRESIKARARITVFIQLNTRRFDLPRQIDPVNHQVSSIPRYPVFAYLPLPDPRIHPATISILLSTTSIVDTPIPPRTHGQQTTTLTAESRSPRSYLLRKLPY